MRIPGSGNSMSQSRCFEREYNPASVSGIGCEREEGGRESWKVDQGPSRKGQVGDSNGLRPHVSFTEAGLCLSTCSRMCHLTYSDRGVLCDEKGP